MKDIPTFGVIGRVNKGKSRLFLPWDKTKRLE